MTQKQRQILVVTVGMLIAQVPMALMLPDWRGYAVGVWMTGVAVLTYFLAGRPGTPWKLPEFIHALHGEGVVHLDRRCTMDNPTSKALNDFLQVADHELTGISASASRLVPISRELADSYMMVQQKSQMQNQYGNAVAESVQELENMRMLVHGQNQEISAAVADAVHGADASLATVDVTSHSMQTLADSTEQTAQQIDVLTNVNTEILGIAQTITEIAESTNLLALNAAIEAARAGEHGRGFAVVADEVRRLSTQTQAATAHIRELADSVGAESEKTVGQIMRTRDSAISTQEQMDKASTEISNIATAVQRIKELSDAITVAMQHQQEVAETANENVQALVDLNESVVANNRSHTVSEADLIKLSDTIRDRFSRFVMTEEGWDITMRPKSEATIRQRLRESAQAQAATSADSVELF